MQAKRAAQPLQPCATLPETPPGPDSIDADGMAQASLQKSFLRPSPEADAEPVQAEGRSSTCGDSSITHVRAADSSQPEPSQTGQASSGAGTDAGIACSECIICWEAAANVLLQPCGHICACSECAALLEHLDCPMCRCKVQCSIIMQL